MTNDIRVVITGSRHWRCETLALRILARIKARYGDRLILSQGAAPGVDAAFDLACHKLGVRRDPHPADWSVGRGGGPQRNGRMLRAEPRPAFVLAVHRRIGESKGTRDCVTQALALGIPVWLVDAEDGEPVRLREMPRWP